MTGDLVGYANGSIVTINPAAGEVMDQGATFMEDAAIADEVVVPFDFNNKIMHVGGVDIVSPTEGTDTVFAVL